ncbi:hypothetical protein C4D60_Mb06t24470 [Musa balbisiana]|uniref:Uncharacterized protein n=1 Tax=Musa balbisiana TaxID=52838 RepID=A0A4S8IQE4_MUSBA|nr:hypothetical protein C4D60_Mb06t24470 [Musa balbisiana]
MGCSYSQLEADGETRSSLRRVQDQRRPMDGRVFKGSFVSTANLVPSECSEAGDDHNTSQQARKSTSAHAASGAPNRAPKQVQEYEGKKKKAGLGPGLKDEGKGGKADEEEEFPGSPSFRFYTEGPWVNNDSADASGHGKDQELKSKDNNCLQKKRKCWVDCRLGRLMRKKENDLHQEDDSITSSSLSKEPECQSRREGDLKLYQRDPMLSLSPVLGGVDYFLDDQNKPESES